MSNLNGKGDSIGIAKKSSRAILAVRLANGLKMEEQGVAGAQWDADNEKEGPSYDEIYRLRKETEILQQKLAQRDAELEALTKQLTEAKEIQNTFLSMAAHDLRGTLASIRVAALALLSTETSLSDVETRSFLEDIGKQANYMWEMMSTLLDVTQFALGKLQIELKTVSVQSFLESLIERQSRLAAAKNIQVLLKTVDAGTVQGRSYPLTAGG